MDKRPSTHRHHHYHYYGSNEQKTQEQSHYYPVRMDSQEKPASKVSVCVTQESGAASRLSPNPQETGQAYVQRYFQSRQAVMANASALQRHQYQQQQQQHQQQHQQQQQAAAMQIGERLAEIDRRNAIKKLSEMRLQKNIQAVDKNVEALKELHASIPAINKIFDVQCRIGSGTFSTVLLGTLQGERCLLETQRRRFAIKHHNPTGHPERILRELECMVRIGGVDNVIGINCCIRCNDNVAFVMPYMTHDRFHDIYKVLSVQEVRDYMRNLLIALRHVHRFNVIHRDVKPSNILFNRRTGKFLLCDFGLAQRIADDGTVIQASDFGAFSFLRDIDAVGNMMLQDGNSAQAEAEDYLATRKVRALGGGGGVDHPLKRPPSFLKFREPLSKKDMANQKADTLKLLNRLRFISPQTNPDNYVVPSVSVKKEMHASRAGTPGYRPPEVLLRHPHQTTAVDVWASGVIMISMLSALHPFFKAPNDCSALAEIMNLVGDIPVRKVAFMMDRLILLTQKRNPLDLRRVCMRLRYAEYFLAPEMQRRHRRADGSTEMCRSCDQPTYNCICRNSGHKLELYEGLDIFPSNAYDLLSRLLEVNPEKRITAEEALKHPFFSDQQRIVSGVPLHQQQLITRESLPAAAARTLKPFVSYPAELTTSMPNNI